MSDLEMAIELLGMLLRQPRTLILIVLLLAAALIDWRAMRIPNSLTLGGATLGLLMSGLAPASPHMGLGFALSGLVIGLGMMLPLYLMGVLGAGDAKLMAMVGTYLGGEATLQAVAFVFITGGLMALAVVLWRRAWRPTLSNLKSIVLMLRVAPETVIQPQGVLSSMPSVGRMPYGVSICAGTLAYLVSHQLGVV